jgi:SAM-dependent methyltransferase
LIERTSLREINKLLVQNANWKVLDIGCGFTAHEKAGYIADVQDFSEFYKDKKKFVQIKDKKLPFENKEFDFVIASHVIEHVEDFPFFISEIERISSQGYIELPTRLGDNLIFENVTDHIWWFVFDDTKKKLIACRRTQSLEPFLSVASGKILSDKFRESFVLELFWKNKIEFEISDEFKNDSDKKIQFFSLIKKYFSKKIRKLLSR